MIPVTKPRLPERARLDSYIDRIYDKCWLTNNGPLVKELTERLKEHLEVEHLLLISNGTLALQIAYRALGIAGAALTTPFSFVATTSTLAWEGISPEFVDIDPGTFCMNPDLIDQAVTEDTTAIVPVHVFGNACEVERIDEIARRRGLKVVYDAAHAFGVRYGDESILKFGDACTLSFHATKLFHTIEGGAIIFKEREALERARLLINFGITGPDSIAGLGINAKMNEFQAAMGLALLDEIDSVFEQRAEIWSHYAAYLGNRLQTQRHNPRSTNNYAYFPVLFKNEQDLLNAVRALKEHCINPRRYFFPSLDTLSYVPKKEMTVSRDISARILCLPLFAELTKRDIEHICDVACDAAGAS